MITIQIILALIAAICAYMVLACLSGYPSYDPENDGRAYASALAANCVFVLVLAAEFGWYS